MVFFSMEKWFLDTGLSYCTKSTLCTVQCKSQILPLWHLYLMCSQRLTKGGHIQEQDTEFQLLEYSTRSRNGGSVT